MASQTNTAVGSVLGFLLANYSDKSTGTGSFETAGWSTDELTPAEMVWQGYLKDFDPSTEPSFLADPSAETPSASPAAASPNPPSPMDVSYHGYKSRRIIDANFYYALDSIATNYIALKIGNIGAAPDSKVPQILLSKAQGLQAIAKAGIARFDEWCRTESAVYGANIIADVQATLANGNAVSDVYGDASSGVDEAVDFFHKNAADFKWTVDPSVFNQCAAPASPSGFSPSPGGSAWDSPEMVNRNMTWVVTYGGFGYALRNVAAKLMVRGMTYSDARDPQIAAYYQKLAADLADISSKIIELYEKFVMAQKIQLAVFRSGI